MEVEDTLIGPTFSELVVVDEVVVLLVDDGNKVDEVRVSLVGNVDDIAQAFLPSTIAESTFSSKLKTALLSIYITAAIFI